MKPYFYLVSMLTIGLAGCHTIRPGATPTNALISDVPSLDRNVALIMDADYTGFISKDRGNPLADPQKFMIGAALGPLTEAYFGKAARTLKTYPTMDQAKVEGGADLYVHPRVSSFDNTLRLGGQRVDIVLASDIYDKDLKLIQTVEGRSMGTGETSTKSANNTVSTALQMALIDLIKNIQDSLNP